MKSTSTLLVILITLVVNASYAGDREFVASTPAAREVRQFLGISLTDSIDFIRWKLTLSEKTFDISCNYGIGKPNTNGFYDGGKMATFSGTLQLMGSEIHLSHKDNILRLTEINSNLLHIIGEDKSFLIGNGGWSYTLNSTNPSRLAVDNNSSKKFSINKSAVFQGRTPCGIPDLIPPEKTCYKIKWLVTFSSTDQSGSIGNFVIAGTPWRGNSKKGTWETTLTTDGNSIYQLKDESGRKFLYLLRLDANIMFFTNAAWEPLVGDSDFSFTLNKKN